MIFKTIPVIFAAGALLVAQTPQSTPPGRDQPHSSQDQNTSGHKSSDRGMSTQGAGSSSLSSADRMFVQKAAMGGHKEVELAKMAVDKASSADVKSFAQRLVDDHTKANQELMQLATQKGISTGMEGSMDAPGSSNASTMNKGDKVSGQFANLTGDKFDKAFVKHMKSDHEKDIAMFEKQSRSGGDADIKAFAEKTLPTLRAHLDQVKQLEQSMKSSSTAKTSSNN